MTNTQTLDLLNIHMQKQVGITNLKTLVTKFLYLFFLHKEMFKEFYLKDTCTKRLKRMQRILDRYFSLTNIKSAIYVHIYMYICTQTQILKVDQLQKSDQISKFWG